jgi:predicted aspartyl protease
MGLTHQTLMVKATRKSRRAVTIEFLVDSGAVYSLVPAKRLKAIGIKPYKTLDFALADGSIMSRKVGDAYFEYRGDGGAAPVIFGEDGDQPLLGATTLESLALVLNPFRRELHRMKLMLMRLDQKRGRGMASLD